MKERGGEREIKEVKDMKGKEREENESENEEVSKEMKHRKMEVLLEGEIWDSNEGQGRQKRSQ
jgi:hypothetical protein